jgi:hypothetical protein
MPKIWSTQSRQQQKQSKARRAKAAKTPMTMPAMAPGLRPPLEDITPPPLVTPVATAVPRLVVTVGDTVRVTRVPLMVVGRIPTVPVPPTRAAVVAPLLPSSAQILSCVLAQ